MASTVYLSRLVKKLTGLRQKKQEDVIYFQHMVSVQTKGKTMHVSIDMGKVYFSFSEQDHTVTIYNASTEETNTIRKTFLSIYPHFQIRNL